MKSGCIYTCILLCLYVYNSYGQTLDDNIVITQCNDSYVFMEKDGIPAVRNRKETSYEATRMGTTLQPYTYYGEFISLDGASAKGGGKAEYKSITPENVFFDDSKVCFFNINLDRKGKKTEVTFKGEFYQFNLSSCIRQQNSLTAQFVSFSLSNLANIFYPSQFLQ